MSKPLTCAECGAPVNLEVSLVEVYHDLTEDDLEVEGGEVEERHTPDGRQIEDSDASIVCSEHPHHSTGYLEYDPKTLEYRITKEVQS